MANFVCESVHGEVKKGLYVIMTGWFSLFY